MRTIVLIEAGDLEIGSVFIAHSRDELIALVGSKYLEAEKEYPIMKGKGEALIKMIQAHEHWSLGCHDLEIIEPHFYNWELIITEGRYGAIN